jgi:hypothetical protein|tara:strand:- start:368 stop:592 length:225 start_codon:yes stop_codon:yes gene_type:complete
MSSPNSVTVTQVSDVTTVELTTAGPQGPTFSSSGATLDDSAKVNDSVVYFDSSSGTFKADATTTKLTLVNGGNF